MPPFSSYFEGLDVGQFLTMSSKAPIIAHYHLCLDMFEGKVLISI